MARQKSPHRDLSASALVDTGYLVALLRKRDQYHSQANGWQRWVVGRKARLVVTEAVLWKWLDGLSDPAVRQQAAQGYRRLHQDKLVEVVPFDLRRIEAAFALYESRPDKGWSLTDCFSFVVMQERRLTNALTADHHFVQAGFRALLLEEPPSRSE